MLSMLPAAAALLRLSRTGSAGIVMARSNFPVAELLDGDLRHWAGWAGHRLQITADGYSILAKQVNLIDCDRNVRNPSLTL